MNRYEKQNAAERIDGYYLVLPHESAVGREEVAFERAKAETLNKMRAAIKATEALTAADFFAITRRKCPKPQALPLTNDRITMRDVQSDR